MTRVGVMTMEFPDYEAEQPQHPDNIKLKEEPVSVVQASLDERILILPDVDEVEWTPVEEGVPSQPPFPLVPPQPPELPSLKTCPPREVLEHFIFPVLLPGMTELLHQAKKEKCFEVSD
uniref:Uncharacterized protein n=1 Tax=Sphaerodactylus townsendi TaxID=933632 RepID=A0ACB8FL68_9SAUR